VPKSEFEKKIVYKMEQKIREFVSVMLHSENTSILE